MADDSPAGSRIRASAANAVSAPFDVVAVEGEIDHRDVFFSDQQKHDNRKICPCVSRAIGVVTIDTLYRPEAAHR